MLTQSPNLMASPVQLGRVPVPIRTVVPHVCLCCCAAALLLSPLLRYAVDVLSITSSLSLSTPLHSRVTRSPQPKTRLLTSSFFTSNYNHYNRTKINTYFWFYFSYYINRFALASLYYYKKNC